jgi:hypothetical protein
MHLALSVKILWVTLVIALSVCIDKHEAYHLPHALSGSRHSKLLNPVHENLLFSLPLSAGATNVALDVVHSQPGNRK